MLSFHKTSIQVSRIMRIVVILLSLCINTLHLAAQNQLVGSLGGEVAVSSLGLATYSIPIEVVPGTRGVQPNLTVTYNSAGGRGLLGSCWDLTGLSSITRTPRTGYHDGDIGSVNFDANDRYNIDGERLVKLSTGTYAVSGAVYGKETEDFVRVTLNGTPDTDTQFFTAVTAGGTVVEYGTDGHSKQQLNGRTLAWWVRKVTDPDGNTMAFQYSLSNGEIVPDRIFYTSNETAGLSAYAKVIFEYNTDPNPNKVWIGGQPMTFSRLLTGITICYGSDTVRRYTFEYDHDRTSRLTAIVLRDELNTELTRTTVSWGQDGSSVSCRVLQGMLGQSIITGDFNGDNITDLFLYSYNQNDNRTEWSLKEGTTSGLFSQTNLSGSLTGYAAPGAIFAVDLEGNGTDEVCCIITGIPQDSCSLHAIHPYNTGCTHDTLAVNKTPDFHVGDFLGNGHIQVVAVGEASGGQKTATCLANNASFTVHKDSRINVTDINGNGKSDIQVVKDHTIDVYEYDAATEGFVKLIDSHYATYVSTRDYFGDFNGDGNTDYVYFSPSGFHMKLSKGTDYSPSYSLPFYSLQNGNGTPAYSLFIADVNADGKDDILQPVFNYQTQKLTTTVYLSRGFFDELYQYDTIRFQNDNISNWTESMYMFAEMDGDGQLELFYSGSIFDNPVVVSFPERREHDLVGLLTNGFGKPTWIRYGYYNTPHVGWVGLCGKRVLWPLATRIAEPDGIGGVSVAFHTFHGAVYDPGRRVLLGFNIHESYHDGMNHRQTFLHDTVTHRLALEQEIDYFLTKDTTSIGGYVHDLRFWQLTRNLFFHNESYHTPSALTLPFGRLVPYNQVSSQVDRLCNSKTTSCTWLRDDGRIGWTSTAYSKAEPQNGLPPAWLERDSTAYSYQTILLPNGKQATVPDTVRTWHRRNGFNQTLWTVTNYGYSSGKLSSTTLTDNEGQVMTTKYTYNTLGLCTSDTVVPYGLARATTAYGYDNKGRFATTVTDALGYSRQKEYDKHTGLVTEETDPNGLTTSYEYDALGNVTRITRPDGTVRRIAFEWNTDSAYPDALWRIREYETGRPESIQWHDSLGRTIHTYVEGHGYDDVVYDHLGRAVMTTFLPYESPLYIFQRRVWHTTEYDRYGRTVAETDPITNLDYSYYDPVTSPNGDYYVTFIDSIRGTQRTTFTDALGKPLQNVDAGGAINYAYDYVTVDGRTLDRTRVTIGNAVTTILSDVRGNRVSLSDPDAGTVLYEHDALGRLVERTDAKGNVITYTYDLVGRPLTETLSDGLVTETVGYTYDEANGAGIGKIASVSHNGVEEYAYEYDNLGRLSRFDVHDGSNRHSHFYQYDALGRLQYLTYPSGFTLKHTYNNYGELLALLNDYDNSLVFSADVRDRFRHPLKCRYGNGTGVQYTYNDYGLVTAVRNGDVTDGTNVESLGPDPMPDANYYVGTEYRQLAYTYNPRCFIASRSDTNTGQCESFDYDILDRLVTHTVNGTTTHTYTYDASGNITASTEAGNYYYGDAGPHAVTQVRGNFIQASQNVFYGVRGLPASISENGYTLQIDYGADGMRKHTRCLFNNTILKTVTRVSDVHEVEVEGNTIRQLDYVYFEGNVVAVHVTNNSTDSLYYVLTDHLNSWDMVLNQDKDVVQQTHFDPWGNRMSHSSWTTPQVQISFPFSRGFTGHEHYDRFKLVNANARLYDPVIGRFLSPDPFVQIPDFTQSYNRYSYCLNNPVMYIDPDGELFGTLLGLASDLINNFFVRTFKGEKWDWTQTKYGWEIDNSLFYTDPNKSTGERAWEFISRLTWQLPQTIIGDLFVSVMNAFGKVNSVTHAYGMTALDIGSRGAVSIGFYTAGPDGYKADWRDHKFVHEYGHYVQSQQFGPAYLIAIALPSLQSAILHNNTDYSHYKRWFETDANYKGSAYFDKYYGSGKVGYSEGNPNYFDMDSFVKGNASSYNNPRTKLPNTSRHSIYAEFNWTDIIIYLPIIGLFPCLL